MKNLIGQKVSPILEEVENLLLENILVMPNDPPNYTDEGFRAVIFIFGNAMLDKSWHLCEKEGHTYEDKSKMLMQMAIDIKKLVKTYCDIDTLDLYK